jgi:hypothetical protein
MVQNMTLPEKVNVTTGVGWSMGLCVGNTGKHITISYDYFDMCTDLAKVLLLKPVFLPYAFRTVPWGSVLLTK